MPAKNFQAQKEGYNTKKNIEEKYHLSHKNDSSRVIILYSVLSHLTCHV